MDNTMQPWLKQNETKQNPPNPKVIGLRQNLANKLLLYGVSEQFFLYFLSLSLSLALVSQSHMSVHLKHIR